MERHIQHMTSGPSLCVGVERENAVKKLLDLLGPEDPQSARRQSQFYWRGVFGADSVMNAMYCKFKVYTSCYVFISKISANEYVRLILKLLRGCFKC